MLVPVPPEPRTPIATRARASSCVGQARASPSSTMTLTVFPVRSTRSDVTAFCAKGHPAPLIFKRAAISQVKGQRDATGAALVAAVHRFEMRARSNTFLAMTEISSRVSEEKLRATALHALHAERGARFVPFVVGPKAA